MKVVAVEFARSAQVFVQEEVRPASGAYFIEGTRLIAERYGFAITPTTADIATGAKFSGGRLIAGTKRINISDMTVFANAVQVTTQTNTSDSDYVVDDVIAWGMSTLGFRPPQTIFPHLYESAIIVDFETPTDHLLRPFEKLQASFRRQMEAHYGLRDDVAFTSFSLGTDPLKLAAKLVPPISTTLKPEFGLIRRTNAPYEADRFFALAPIKTDEHMLLLEEFERAIPKRS